MLVYIYILLIFTNEREKEREKEKGGEEEEENDWKAIRWGEVASRSESRPEALSCKRSEREERKRERKKTFIYIYIYVYKKKAKRWRARAIHKVYRVCAEGFHLDIFFCILRFFGVSTWAAPCVNRISAHTPGIFVSLFSCCHFFTLRYVLLCHLDLLPVKSYLVYNLLLGLCRAHWLMPVVLFYTIRKRERES